MKTATTTEITLTPASRNLSLWWAVSQREQPVAPKGQTFGLKGLQAAMRGAKRVAGGCYYNQALYVGGKRVVGLNGCYDLQVLAENIAEFGAWTVEVEA